MWGKKNVLIIVLVALVLMATGIGGVALARGGGLGGPGGVDLAVSANVTQHQTILARVAQILGIDQTKLESAFKQAQSEQHLDALKTRLQNLVQQGVITQTQADDYLKWSQSKPDMAPYEQQLKDWQQNRPSVPPALKDWMQNRPLVPPDLKNWQESKPNFQLPGGMGGRRDFRGMRGQGGAGTMRGIALPQGLPTN